MTVESVHAAECSYRTPTSSKSLFENLVHKSLPTWSATWNVLLQANQDSCRGLRRSRASHKSTSDLHMKIRRKVTDLVHKEEALVDLYEKAADAAKDRESQFRSRTAILTEQIKRDKNLINILK